jgi:hypothetical protein
VEEELTQDYAWMHLHDRNAFRVHYAMARQLGDEQAAEFEARYKFHFALQTLHQTLVGWTNHVNETLSALQGARQVPQEQFQHTVAVLRKYRDVLAEQLYAADQLQVPALTNMNAGAKLGPYLFNQAVVDDLPAGASNLNGEWISALMNQVGEVTNKAARVLFKSLGGILALQDRYAADWHVRRAESAPVPTEPPADTPGEVGPQAS